MCELGRTAPWRRLPEAPPHPTLAESVNCQAHPIAAPPAACAWQGVIDARLMPYRATEEPSRSVRLGDCSTADPALNGFRVASSG
jgi:hypothetical protein